MSLKFLAVLLAAAPALSAGAWQTISSEPGKRIEIDRASIKKDDGGKSVALGRIVLEKPITDHKTSAAYRIIEALNRYDCGTRAYSTLKRSYYREEGDLLREEEIKAPIELPVRSGTLDDKLLRDVCRPQPGVAAQLAATKTAEKINEAAGELRKANAALLQKDLGRAAANTPVSAPVPERASPPSAAVAPRPAPGKADRPAAVAHALARIQWSYEGEGRPEQWGKLKPDFATCDVGKRQSPIDIRDAIQVDLEPIRFNYRPSQFRVLDNGHTVQVAVGGSSISLLGKSYALTELHFHRPAEEWVNGKAFDMGVHLVHQAEDGKLAILAIPLENGADSPLIQTVWNNLPLEKHEAVAPPGLSIDVAQLLPENRGYYAYMGSRTTPPCSEGVLWLVMKQPMPISQQQMAIFARLYKNNARPVQPVFDRVIKESR